MVIKIPLLGVCLILLCSTTVALAPEPAFESFPDFELLPPGLDSHHIPDHGKRGLPFGWETHGQDPRGRIHYANFSAKHPPHLIYLEKQPGFTILCDHASIHFHRSNVHRRVDIDDLLLVTKGACSNYPADYPPMLFRVVVVVRRGDAVQADIEMANPNDAFEDLSVKTYTEHMVGHSCHDLSDDHPVSVQRRDQLPAHIFQRYVVATKRAEPEATTTYAKLASDVTSKGRSLVSYLKTESRRVGKFVSSMDISAEDSPSARGLTTLQAVNEGKVSRRIFDKAWKFLKEQYEKARKEVSGLVSKFKELGGKVAGLAKQVATAAKGYWEQVKGGMAKVRDALGKGVEWVKEKLEKLGDFFADTIRKIIKFIEELVERVKNLGTMKMNIDLLQLAKDAGAPIPDIPSEHLLPPDFVCDKVPALLKGSEDGVTCPISFPKVGFSLHPVMTFELDIIKFALKSYRFIMGGQIMGYFYMKVLIGARYAFQRMLKRGQLSNGLRLPLGPLHLSVLPSFWSTVTFDAYAQIETNTFGAEAGLSLYVGVEGDGRGAPRPILKGTPHADYTRPELLRADGGATVALWNVFRLDVALGIGPIMANLIDFRVGQQNFLDLIASIEDIDICADLRFRMEIESDLLIYIRPNIPEPLAGWLTHKIYDPKSLQLYRHSQNLLGVCAGPDGFSTWSGASLTNATQRYDEIMRARMVELKESVGVFAGTVPQITVSSEPVLVNNPEKKRPVPQIPGGGIKAKVAAAKQRLSGIQAEIAQLKAKLEL